MKKRVGILCGLLSVLLVVGIAFAGDSGLVNNVTKFTQPSLGGDDGLAAKTKEFNDDVVTWADALGSTTELTVDAKYVAVGPDATTGLMVQGGTNVFSTDGTVTQAFTVAYSSKQPVVASYNENSIIATNIFHTSNDGTNVVLVGVAGLGFDWVSVGIRP